MTVSGTRSGNWILDALPPDEAERLTALTEPFELRATETLFAPEIDSPWAYFPVTGVISFVRGFKDGSEVEVGVVGREGMAGVHGFLGKGLEPTRAVVQCDGHALRMEISTVSEEFNRGGVFQNLLLRFLYSLVTQVSLTAACNQLHTVDQRLARWLLAMGDRVASNEIPLSHEFLASMLGTGRARVTEAIGRFKDRGGVSSGRGRVVIEDRNALEREACECYEEMRSSYAALVESRDAQRPAAEGP